MPPGKNIRQVLRIDRALRLVWKSAPGWTLAGMALVLLQGLLPLAALFLVKQVVDAVAAGVTAPDKSAAFREVLFWVLLAGGAALLNAVCRSLSEQAGEAQALAVTDDVSDVIHARSVAADLGYYEDARYHDTLHRAQLEAPYRPTRIVNGLAQVGQGGIALIGIAALLFSFNWMSGVVLFAAAVPGALARLVYSRKRYGFEQEQSETERRSWYYHWMMTEGSHAKEIRLFDLGPLFRSRFKDLRGRLRKGRLALSRTRSLTDLLTQAAAVAAIFGAFGFMSWQAVKGEITLGGLVMYYQGFQSGLGFLQSVLRGLAGLYEDNLFLADFYRFLDLAPTVRAPARPQPLPSPIRKGIAFENVRFAYPGAAEEAPSAIDLSLAPGEVIALVGENGSGKTTLVKLLCRLYDPTGGRITLDGIDLKDLDPVAWRRCIGITFQDYVNYCLSARESIWLGDAAGDVDGERIVRAARHSGADPVIGRLPRGYDTLLGRRFDGGHELSVGEWQKVALARAFYRDAPIVVLDEPTSSLDPLAEAELFNRFRGLIAGKSAVLISHRFSTVRMADRIYVLDRGRIVEQGSHEALLRNDGRYSRLYRAQAERYGGDFAGHRS